MNVINEKPPKKQSFFTRCPQWGGIVWIQLVSFTALLLTSIWVGVPSFLGKWSGVGFGFTSNYLQNWKTFVSFHLICLFLPLFGWFVEFLWLNSLELASDISYFGLSFYIKRHYVFQSYSNCLRKNVSYRFEFFSCNLYCFLFLCVLEFCWNESITKRSFGNHSFLDWFSCFHMLLSAIRNSLFSFRHLFLLLTSNIIFQRTKIMALTETQLFRCDLLGSFYSFCCHWNRWTTRNFSILST